MLIADLPKPVAVFYCGELDESYPQAHAAFLTEFACFIDHVPFAVDGTEALWAFPGDGEAYKWDGRTWVDMVPWQPE